MRAGGGREESAGKTGAILRMVFILTFVFQSLVPVSLGQGIQAIPSSLKSPQDIERWISNFKYQMKIPDAPQSVEETLASGAGDCDDLAKVVSKALSGLGISSNVVVIKSKGMAIRHAICIWKSEDGTYDFFSNQQMIRSGEKNMEVAIQKNFRRYESSFILSPEELKAPANEDPLAWGRSRGHFRGYKRGTSSFI
jgi:hypothetical protein